MKLHLNNYYFLCIIAVSFVFISTTAISLNKTAEENKVPTSKQSITEKRFPDNPVLKAGASFPVLSAQGVMIEDLGSGITLYEKNPNANLLPASTTKIVTALVAMDAYPLDQVMTVPKGASVEGQKMGLYVGEQMKVHDLLYGLLVYSANDAAMTLAMNYPGGFEAFITAMNEKAKVINMTNSYFENPVGLDGANQITTAKDLLRASQVAMRNPVFAEIVGTKSITLSDATGKTKYNLNNINELLGDTPGVMGVKTGWTENARENLVTYMERDGHKLIIVVLGSQDRFGETKELINWVFDNYDWQEVKVPQVLNI